MPIRFSPQRALLLAATLASALAACPAAAQQSTPTPPPPTPNQPTSDAATKLRGINPPPFPMAADKLPIPQLKLPKGFKIEVFMSGVPNARSLRLGDKGTVFVSNRLLDKVYAVVEKDGKRELKVIASGLDRPNGLAFHDGTLYIAEGTKVSKLEKIEDNLDNPPKPIVIYNQFPNHQSHGWKFIAVGPDNKLYINVGAPCNICLPPETNAQIRRMNLDGSRSETYVRGVRNSVGFDFHPVTKELYFTDNGRDWLSEDLPNDELNRVTKAGQHFGYPYCHQRSLVLAGTLSTLLVAAGPAAAQQQAPLPPGSPLMGRPDTEAAKKLAPVAPPPTPTAADKVSVDKLKAPKGFTIEVYATGVDNARTLRLGDKGTVFVSSRIKDKIHAIVDKGGKREVKVVASGLYRPNGIVLHKGTLYIAELSQISKIENVEDKLDNPPKPTVIFSDLPKDEGHGWKYLTIGPDEKLYFQVGAPCNICMPSERHAKIYRLNLDGSGLEVVASGIRQIVGMDWHPTSKQLYFTENSRDWLSEDIPQDKLNRVTQPGKDNFGFPYCHQGNIPDQEFGWGHSCDEFTKPVALLGPHVAPLGMRFYTGTMFPAAYRNQIIIARHGSWNRSNKAGGDLVVVKLKPDGSFKSMEPFVTGFLENNNYIGRPADVLVMKDGSLLVSDDYNGAVYRVSYGAQRTAAGR